MRKTCCTLVVTGLLAALGAQAQTVEEFKSPKTQCCLAGTIQRYANQLDDWNQLGQSTLPTRN